MVNTGNQFGVVDYIVLSVMVLFSIVIGVYHAFRGGKQNTTEEFLLANRDMNPIPVGLSIAATFVSSLTVLGLPGDVYANGLDWCFNLIGMLCGGLVASRFFVPVFFRLNLTSAYEYFELRFNRVARYCVLISFLLLTNMYMGLVMYGPAIAINVVTGLSLWGSIIATGLVCTFYTTIGGMKAVLWTDAFQIIFIIAGLITAAVEASRRVGGMENVWNIAKEADRVVLNWSFDPTIRHTVWSVTFGSCFFWCAIYCTNQTMIQRYLTLKTVRKGRIAISIGCVCMALLSITAILAGITIFAYYDGCDPLTLGVIKKRDQVIIYFIMDVLGGYPGLPGIFVASIFGATLSTVSSGMNALAAVTLQDVVKPFYKNMNEDTTTKITKLFALLYGLSAIFIAYAISIFGAGLLQFGFASFGLIGGPMLGIFLLGIYFPCANSKGAVTGFLVGFSLSCWIVIGTIINPTARSTPPLSATNCVNVTTTEMIPTTVIQDMTATNTESMQPMINRLYTVSYMLYTCIGCCTTIVVGLFVSYVTGANKPSDVDPSLLYTVPDAICCCLPKSCKNGLLCCKSRYYDIGQEPTKELDEVERQDSGIEPHIDIQQNYSIEEQGKVVRKEIVVEESVQNKVNRSNNKQTRDF